MELFLISEVQLLYLAWYFVSNKLVFRCTAIKLLILSNRLLLQSVGFNLYCLSETDLFVDYIVVYASVVVSNIGITFLPLLLVSDAFFVICRLVNLLLFATIFILICNPQ